MAALPVTDNGGLVAVLSLGKPRDLFGMRRPLSAGKATTPWPCFSRYTAACVAAAAALRCGLGLRASPRGARRVAEVGGPPTAGAALRLRARGMPAPRRLRRPCPPLRPLLGPLVPPRRPFPAAPPFGGASRGRLRLPLGEGAFRGPPERVPPSADGGGQSPINRFTEGHFLWSQAGGLHYQKRGVDKMRQKCYNYEVMRSHRLRCIQPPSSWGVSIKTVSSGASRRDGFLSPK